MGIQLNAVNNFCEEGFKKGKIVPLSFEFPAFKITEEMFKDSAKEIVSDRIRLGMESGQYGHPLLKNVSYDDLVESQIAKSKNRATQHQNGQVVFSEKILPIQMNKDENLNYSELNRKILAELCDSRLKYSFAKVESYSGAYEEEYSKAMVVKDKFVATMVMMKEMIPNAYRQMTLSLKNHPNQHLVSEIRSMEEHPGMNVIKHILDIEPKFAEKHFPKETKYLAESDKFMNDFKSSKIKF